MTYEERQAQLLDDYLTALQQNPEAQAPDDLNPEMAEFARMMAGSDQTEFDNTGAKGRIWQNIQAEQTSITIHPDFEESEQYMKRLKEKNKRSGRRRGWLPLVATAAASVLVTFILASVIFRGDSNLFAMFTRPDNATVELVVPTIPATATATTIITPIAPVMASTATGFPPTVPPPANVDPFMMTATALVSDATQDAQSAMANATAMVVEAQASRSVFEVRATQLILDATQTAMPAPDPMLECNFDGEFDFRIDRNVVRDSEQLRITGMPFNASTENVIFEIFGGFATNDEFLELESLENPIMGMETTIGIPGDGFENGSYLVRIRLLDGNGKTLSSCGLPVTFAD